MCVFVCECVCSVCLFGLFVMHCVVVWFVFLCGVGVCVCFVFNVFVRFACDV